MTHLLLSGKVNHIVTLQSNYCKLKLAQVFIQVDQGIDTKFFFLDVSLATN